MTFVNGANPMVNPPGQDQRPPFHLRPKALAERRHEGFACAVRYPRLQDRGAAGSTQYPVETRPSSAMIRGSLFPETKGKLRKKAQLRPEVVAESATSRSWGACWAAGHDGCPGGHSRLCPNRPAIEGSWGWIDQTQEAQRGQGQSLFRGFL